MLTVRIALSTRHREKRMPPQSYSRPRGTRAAVLTLALLGLGGWLPYRASAQLDSHTLLWLRFEGTLVGEQGQAPLSASGVSFEQGVIGSGAYFAPGNQVFYS